MPPDLNPAQRDAVATLKGPLLVLAGAGTGKTRVITFRIANLIKHGIAPARILAVTFTNKAAREMQERASGLLGKRQKEKPEISTFHSLCVRVLRRHLTRLGYPEKFAIYDRGDQEGLARGVLRELRVGNETMRPADLLSQIGTWKSRGVMPDKASGVAQSDAEHLAAAAYRRYQKALKLAGAVDFDDLLLCTHELFSKFPEVRRQEAARFDHLLIDEYQDTNGLQYEIVRALAAVHRNLCVVGDDDQSIYGWRGAEVTHILNFNKDWPEAKVVRLEENYRSVGPILRIANELIAFNQHRHDKLLRATRTEGPEPRFLRYKDETEESTGVVREIANLVQEKVARYKDFAILFRTNEQPRAFETELRRVQIPYVLVGGMSFYDRREVRDILAYLKLLDQPNDEVSLLRIINTPARGIGQGTVKRLMEAAVERGKPMWETLPLAISDGEVPYAAAQSIEAFRAMIERLRARLATFEYPVDIIRDLIQEIDYKAELARNHTDPMDQEARWNVVEQVVNSIALYFERASKPTLRDFLEETALGGRDEQADKDPEFQRDAVMLMTLHSAKGLEFPHVYLVGMEEGLLPHRRSVADDAGIDEERRLAYVGVTRAQEFLTLTLAMERMKWGRSKPTIPSRFIWEMQGAAEKPEVQELRQRSVSMAKAELSGEKGRAKFKKQAKAAGKTKKSSKKKPDPKSAPRTIAARKKPG